jgi:hypothetical protein
MSLPVLYCIVGVLSASAIFLVWERKGPLEPARGKEE